MRFEESFLLLGGGEELGKRGCLVLLLSMIVFKGNSCVLLVPLSTRLRPCHERTQVSLVMRHKVWSRIGRSVVCADPIGLSHMMSTSATAIGTAITALTVNRGRLDLELLHFCALCQRNRILSRVVLLQVSHLTRLIFFVGARRCLACATIIAEDRDSKAWAN